MIETLMALWNRGVGGRLMVIAVTFFCICISISLLFVTVGGAWGALFARAHPGDGGTHIVNSALITATAPTSVATSQVVATPAITPVPCLASPTSANGLTPLTRVTVKSGQTGVPVQHASVTPTQPRKTPAPVATATPKPKPSPTPPAVTPTAVVTPTATTPPPVTMTPTVTVTPTVTGTPAVTPTVVSTPTVTTTPGATPTSTPTIVVAPTDTTTPAASQTVTITTTAITTPTVTTPAGSPTPVTSVTAGAGNTRTPNSGSVKYGTPAGVDSGQPGCLSDSLATGGTGTVLSLLQNFLWLILATSLLGTALFCAQMYRMTHRRAERGM